MSQGSWLGTIEQGAWGAIKQIANVAMGSIRIPISALPDAPIGDVIEPVGDGQRAGANWVERLAKSLGIGHVRPNAQTSRLTRPLLAETTIVVDQAQVVTQLSFSAHGAGLDWARAGHESALVAVYVDGRYHSSVLVLAERDGSYSINLGALTAGPHHVEVRLGRDLAGPSDALVGVSNLRSEALSGDEALIAAHAPIIQYRDDARDPRLAATHNDAPLQMIPIVTPRVGGGRRIDYRVVFSNEDGGTHLDQLLNKYGRGIDSEIVYSVELSAAGTVISETYQSPIHSTKAFDGQHEGSRPVLRISSANNMVSARTAAGAERWSESTIAPGTPATSDLDLLRGSPWIAAVMGKEMLREHDVDARRYIYVGALSDTARAALVATGGVMLTLSDGRRVLAHIASSRAASGNGCTAIELPTGITSDAVRGADLVASSFVLDASFGIRELHAISDTQALDSVP